MSEILLLFVFIFGYAAIAFEHPLRINKTATSLVLAGLCWLIFRYSGTPETSHIGTHLHEHLSGIAEILFFLMGAMTIVELIAAHNGFDHVTRFITTTNKRKLLWIIGLLTFFLSAVLDNLTTTIVMISLLRRLIEERRDRLIFASIIVVAANAGGAWSPVGDVTTTMLWIGGQVSAINIIKELFLPSLICLLVPLAYQSIFVKGNIPDVNPFSQPQPASLTILILGILSLLSVPIFKTITHLPPYLGMLLAVGILWVYTEIIHNKYTDRDHLKINHVLQRIDMSSILFFLGILLSVAALESYGFLHHLATWLDTSIGNKSLIITLLGVLSAIIDNVPLTAAVQGMYDLTQYPTDHEIWEMLAYAVGTGGSLLIIGSAAGVVAMGMERIEFGWYLKNITFTALLGYLVGIGLYLLILNML